MTSVSCKFTSGKVPIGTLYGLMPYLTLHINHISSSKVIEVNNDNQQ